MTVLKCFSIPRAGFTESINAINADFDKAMQYLDGFSISPYQLPAYLLGVH